MNTDRAQRLGRGARETALTVGAVVGALCILAALAAVTFDLRLLVFRSGSMEPAIRTGALGVGHTVSATDLRIGDIVTVPTGSGERVTHRIVSIQEQGASVVLELRGDANTTSDATPYTVTEADRLWFAIAGLGYVAGWLTGPTGMLVLGAYGMFLLSVLLRPRGRERLPQASGDIDGDDLGSQTDATGSNPAADRSLTHRGVVALSLFVLAASAVVPLASHSHDTLAAWSDNVTTGGINFNATGPLQPPTNVTCSGAGLWATPKITWTAPVSGAPPDNRYLVIAHDGSPTGTATSYVVTGTSWTVAGGGTGRHLYITVQSAAGNLWTSSQFAHDGAHVSWGAILGWISTCENNWQPTQPAWS